MKVYYSNNLIRQEKVRFISGLWIRIRIRIRIGSGFNGVPGSGT
jgi:hypothetical protein